MPAVKALIEQQILLERERCAKIAEKYANDPHGSNPSCATGEAIASDIREQPDPRIKLVRPETAVMKPEVLDQNTIVAGIGLHPVTDEIIDREKLAKLSHEHYREHERLAKRVLGPDIDTTKGIFALKYESPGPDPIAVALMSLSLERP